MSRTEQRPRPPRREPEQVWVPRTKLGTLVATEKITTMKEIYENGYRIQVMLRNVCQRNMTREVCYSDLMKNK